MDGYCLEDKLTARQFSELVGLDYELAQTVYAAYAAENDEYNRMIGSLSSYSVPLMDMFLYVCDKLDSGLVTLDEDMTKTLHDAQKQMLSGKAQLQGKDYNRILIYLSPDLEAGDTTYAFTDEIQQIARKYYPEGNIYLAGDVTSEYDFEKSFAVDNKVVSIVSILIVLVVLLFTFQSADMPILLILVIQGSIWINFSFPTFTNSPLFYLSYLVVSSIQMGANIDYAIVIATRYPARHRPAEQNRAGRAHHLCKPRCTGERAPAVQAHPGHLYGRGPSAGPDLGGLRGLHHGGPLPGYPRQGGLCRPLGQPGADQPPRGYRGGSGVHPVHHRTFQQ